MKEILRRFPRLDWCLLALACLLPALDYACTPAQFAAGVATVADVVAELARARARERCRPGDTPDDCLSRCALPASGSGGHGGGR